jgi:hypothetical protein
MAGFCEHDNEPSGFVEAETFLTTRVTISFSVIYDVNKICTFEEICCYAGR